MSIKVKRLVRLYTWAVASQRGLDKFFAAHPEYATHKQSEWGEVMKNGECQTAYCLAGQTAVVEGYAFLADAGFKSGYTTSSSVVPVSEVKRLGLEFVPGTRKGWVRMKGADEYSSIPDDVWDASRTPSDVAQDALGLDEVQAVTLFRGSNDVHDIKEIIEGFFRDAGLNLRLPDPEDVVV